MNYTPRKRLSRVSIPWILSIGICGVGIGQHLSGGFALWFFVIGGAFCALVLWAGILIREQEKP